MVVVRNTMLSASEKRRSRRRVEFDMSVPPLFDIGGSSKKEEGIASNRVMFERRLSQSIFDD